jgi:ABC-2 type transport system ATP-binding protein
VFAIEAIGLSKSFRGVRAVDGVDLLVEAGDVVALLGPNGAGKTTTLMMLLGITDPDAGRVRLLGHAIPEDRSRAMEHVSFTATYAQPPGDLRVRQFLRVFAEIYGVPPARANHIMEVVGITELSGRMGMLLSSGQKTLVGLAKALLNRPRLLILDEPTASLDPEVAARMRRILMDQQAEEGFTMLITSHNMAEIERLCGRVLFLARGRIVADGTPAEVAARYGDRDLESAFLSMAEEARA